MYDTYLLTYLLQMDAPPPPNAECRHDSAVPSPYMAQACTMYTGSMLLREIKHHMGMVWRHVH